MNLKPAKAQHSPKYWDVTLQTGRSMTSRVEVKASTKAKAIAEAKRLLGDLPVMACNEVV